MFFFKSLFLLAPILSAAGAVTNDWSKPCTSGSCSWTTGDGKNTAWGTLEINAVNTKSLSDITTAAGWEILNCDPNSVEPQDIRLVCVDRAKGCDQLFEGGAENTIVRLPENCAGGPFARVKTTWIDEDQSLPPRLAKRQAGKPAQVRGLALDFNFDQIPESNGKVYITATATNSEAQRDALGPALSKRSMMPLRHANKRAQQAAVVRDFATANLARQVPANRVERRFFKKIGKALKKAAKKIGDGVKKVVDKVKDVAAPIVEKVKQVAKPVVKIVEQAAGQVKKFVNAVKDLTSVNIDESASFDLINIDRNFPIISESIDCPAEDGQIGFEAGIDINVDVKAQVTATVGIIISGSIIPPDLDEFAATAGLNGGVVSTFNVKANAKGTFSTGEIELFKAGLPGLSIPGILTVGPSVSLRTQANAELSITADMSLTASYDLPTLELVFPPGAGRDSVADVKPKTENPLRIDVGASVELRGRAEAHLIPRIDIGIDLLKIAKASVFLNVDGFAALNLELDATANGTPVQGDVDGVDVDFSNIETTFGGEISMDLGVSINAGAEASLLSFFNEDTKVELFSATFPVFEKKFGDRAQKREVLALPPAPAKRQANGLICPAPGEANPVNSIA